MFFDAKSFDPAQSPFFQPQKVLELWTKATQDQLARMAEMGKHFETLTEQQTERTREAIDESARLLKSSVDYATKLGGEWRKISLDLANQAVSSATPSSTASSSTTPRA